MAMDSPQPAHHDADQDAAATEPAQITTPEHPNRRFRGFYWAQNDNPTTGISNRIDGPVGDSTVIQANRIEGNIKVGGIILNGDEIRIEGPVVAGTMLTIINADPDAHN